MEKRSEIAINYLIYAALGLVVLILMLAVFGSKIEFFSKSIGATCNEQGGDCATDNRCSDEHPIKIWAKGCPETESKGGWCCLPLER